MARMVTRRTFVGATATLGAVAACPLSAVLDVAPAAASSGLRRSTFAPLVGQRLTMVDSVQTVPVVLEAVVDPSTGPDEGRFSVLFRAAAGSPATSGVRTFSGSGLQPVALFVGPVGPGRHGVLYEAVVNTPVS
jgi:hypothetical protein